MATLSATNLTVYLQAHGLVVTDDEMYPELLEAYTHLRNTGTPSLTREA